MSYLNCLDITTNTDIQATGSYGYKMFLIDCSAGNINITLPINYNVSYKFFRIDNTSNTCTFTCQSGDTINNLTSLTFPINTYSEIYYQVGKKNWLFPKYTFSF